MSKARNSTATLGDRRESPTHHSRGALTNILVEAGAGSGKTQMLAARMAAGIAAGVYQVEHMAAVTFTRKAAAELRGRFQLALEKELERSSQPCKPGARADALRDCTIDALSNLERFFAGTIHSFCARLLRERPVEAGVSPGFTELDEVAGPRAAQARVARLHRQRAQPRAIRHAGARSTPASSPSDLDSAFETVCLNEDVEFPAGRCAQSRSRSRPGRRSSSSGRSCRSTCRRRSIRRTTCTMQKAAREFRGQLRVSRVSPRSAAVMASLLETWDCESTDHAESVGRLGGREEAARGR